MTITNEMMMAEAERVIALRHANFIAGLPAKGYQVTDAELTRAIWCFVVGSHVGRIGA